MATLRTRSAAAGLLLISLGAGLAATRAATPLTGGDSPAVGERPRFEESGAPVEESDADDAVACQDAADPETRQNRLRSSPLVLGLRYPSLALGRPPAEGPGSQFRPIDPATLDDLPGYQPIDFGHHSTQAVSPDGRTLAVMSWPNGTPWQRGGGALRLIDIQSWCQRPTDVYPDEDVFSLTFSPDGRQLFWTQPTARDPGHGIPRGYRLYRYDLAREERTEIAALPYSFLPGDLRIISSGVVVISGGAIGSDGMTEDVPHLYFIDPDSGIQAADLRLDGVSSGQFEDPAASPDEYRWYERRPGITWDLADNRLFVAHADADRVTEVDLAQARIVAEQSFGAVSSAWDRLLAWLVPAADAKVEPETYRAALLSPDGSRLFLTGMRDLVRPPLDRPIIGTPLGIQALDASSLSLVASTDLPITAAWLSPDGARILATSVPRPTEPENVELLLLEAGTLGPLATIDRGDGFSVGGFAPDGRYAYVQGLSTSQRMATRVFDLVTGAFVSERPDVTVLQLSR